MKFVEEIEKLQEENKGIIILAKNGIFFVAIGKDAITLHNTLELKLTCMKKKLCKVGFQVKNVEKYIAKLENAGNSFALYVKEDQNAMEKIYSFQGKDTEETRTCLDCQKCENRKEEEKDILERVRNLGKTK